LPLRFRRSGTFRVSFRDWSRATIFAAFNVNQPIIALRLFTMLM
jgi:hypothetical protein